MEAIGAERAEHNTPAEGHVVLAARRELQESSTLVEREKRRVIGVG